MNWNRIAILLFIGLVVFALVFFTQRPDVLSDIWLWLVGLAGLIIQGLKNLFDFMRKDPALVPETPAATAARQNMAAASQATTTHGVTTIPETVHEDKFDGATITVLRFSDDGATTVGLLYLNGHFYCYTLEDTYHAQKIADNTRIPAGTFSVDFNRADTPLTLKYRNHFPDWFTYHLEIMNVPGFQGVYIHSGGDHNDTSGCLLVSNRLTIDANNTFFTNSQTTFKQLYQYLKETLDKGTRVRLIIRDESWFDHLTT